MRLGIVILAAFGVTTARCRIYRVPDVEFPTDLPERTIACKHPPPRTLMFKSKMSRLKKLTSYLGIVRRDVSPIDEIPGMSQLDESQAPTARPSSQQRSHIPMMRRQRRQTQEAAATTIRESKSRERLRERQDGGETPEQITSATGRQVFKLAQGKDMRWDAMTGEPTLGPSGRSGQVKPHEYAQGLGNTGPVHPAQSALERLRSAQQSFGDRVRKIRTGGAENDAASKPAAAEETATTVSQVSAQEAPPVSPSAAAASPAAALIGNMTSAPNAGPGPKFSPQRTEPVQKRPEWKGGSGRTALVDPVQDMPSIAPLNIPRKSSKRAARGIRGMSTPLSPISPSGSETSSRDAPTVRKVVPSSQHSSHQQGSNSGVSSPLASPATQPAAAAQAYPSPPKTGSPPPPIPPSHANEPLLMDTQLQSLSHAPNPSSANDAEKAIRRKPPSSNNNLTDTPNTHNTHKVHPSTASSVYSQYDPKSSSIGPNTSALPIAEDGWVQPSSRFSVTTYATSAHDSPRPSVDEVPPLPAPPQVKSQSPVMDRKRPPVMGRGRGPAAEYGSPLGSNPVGSSEPVVISLKSAYMTSPFSGAAPKERTSKMAPSAVDRLPPHMRPAPRTNTMMSTDSDRMSVLSTSKALPPAPPEITTMNANDRVAYLNAKLQGLSNRRLNINRSIKQMTELMPTDNLMASDAVIRKREMEKLKVEGLRTELAEVQREEYELGLKLHRAYKRLDRDAQYEPTTLWVRRVTG